MLILTNAFNPGDVDPGKTYARLKIIEFRIGIQTKMLTMYCQYGNDNAGAWEPGKVPTIKVEINNKTSKYDIAVVTSKTLITDEAQPGDGGHNVYVGAGRNLYKWLIDNAVFTGTLA